MKSELEPHLIPKGVLVNPPHADPKTLHDNTTIVDDTPDAGKELVAKARRLEEKLAVANTRITELTERNASLEGKANDFDGLKKELASARKALEDLTAKEGGPIDRRARKFELLKSLLSGFAAHGQLFGREVNESLLDKAIRHAVGVAARAEDAALMKGF